MILEFDIGNTLTKWRLLSPKNAVSVRGHGAIENWMRTGVPDEWLVGGVTRIRAASVVNQNVEKNLAALLFDTYGLGVDFARPKRECSGVVNAYFEPHALGVDRWLAFLAAYKAAAGAVLVADIGSALTIDVVDRSGLHQGGYIIPGPGLMQDSLQRDTQRVRFPEFSTLGGLEFGSDTLGCVSAGIAATQVGAILLARRRAEALLHESIRIFLAGGWSQAVGLLLKEMGCNDFEHAPELVMDGLRWALP